jgi:ubiquinone/menaquinone biosynthesis C-methylase UbiE
VPGRLWQATYGKLFALGYDSVAGCAEKAGLTEMRRQLLAQAQGRTVEIGAGTGVNADHYPDAVTELVLTEPYRHMAAKLRRKLEESGRAAEVVEAPGERLPFDDASFDTAVATLVLCTAPEPAAVLDEIARVLEPGGRFLFLEHVRSEDPGLARWQDRVSPVTNYLFCGCHPNRATLETIERSQLEVEHVVPGELPRKATLPFERPMIQGVARKPAAA